MGSCKDCAYSAPMNPSDSSPRSGQVWCGYAKKYVSAGSSCGKFKS